MPISSRNSWWDFFQTYLRPIWRKFLLMSVLLLSGIVLQLAGPQVAGSFIDIARAGGAIRSLVILAALYLALAVANQLATGFSVYLGQDVGWKATNHLREDLALHCLHLDMTFHNTHTPGELIERVDGDLTALSDFFSIVLVRVFGGALLLLGTLVLLWRVDWRIGLSLNLFVAVAAVVLLSMRRVAIPAGERERDSSALFLGFLEERLGGVEDLRANGGGDYVMTRFYVAMRTWFHRGVNAWLRRASVWTVATLLFSLGTALVLGVSAYFYVHHSITLGQVYLSFQYTVLVQTPLMQITQQLQEFQKAASSLTRVRAVLGIQPTIQDGDGAFGQDEHANTGVAVAFEDVTFAYDDEGPILRDLNFQIAPGQVVGLLGRTGSGKTTISRLLFRLYDTTEGSIRLDGADVRQLPLEALRARVGLVTQDVQLFHATIRDNLTFFDSSVADERIMGVIRDMGLSEWFARLPNGLDTELEAGGDGLSAGEAQLLAFIRVFLRRPGLVILDEPSSRLDPATERLIERGVQALLRGRTGIVIAHRLATVQRADAIMVIENGRLMEYGAREDLARQPDSRFAALMRVGMEEAMA